MKRNYSSQTARYCTASRMRRQWLWVWLILAVIALVACVGESPAEETLAAVREMHSTQLVNLQTTATVERERLQVTVEYVYTRIARAEARQGEMISTLQERGIDTSSLPEAVTLPASPTNEGIPALNATAGPPPSTPTPVIIVTPFSTATATPFPTLANGEPLRLQDIVMATEVGADDCAVGVTNQFRADATRIYVVARAVGVTAGMVITSHWQREGAELRSFDYAPDFDIADACIWFFAEPVDFPFEPGNYTVWLALDGAPASPPIPFTIAAED